MWAAKPHRYSFTSSKSAGFDHLMSCKTVAVTQSLPKPEVSLAGPLFMQVACQQQLAAITKKACGRFNGHPQSSKTAQRAAGQSYVKSSLNIAVRPNCGGPK